MPSVKRQVPTTSVVPVSPQFSAGSVLASAVPVSTIREDRVKVCIYGRNRSGKTSLAAAFPKPLLFVSCEPAHCGGVQSVSDIPGVTLIRVEDKPIDGELLWGRKKVEAVGLELASSDYYKTVVLKTATALQDVILEEMKVEFPGIPLSGRGSKDTFQMRASRLHDAMRPLLDLRHVHVVVISQEKDHNPPMGEGGFPDLKAKLLQTMQLGSFMAPALGAANAQWLQDSCGYVLQIYEDEVQQEITVPVTNPDGTAGQPVVQKVGTGRRQRHLRLQYHPNFAAGGKWNYSPDMPESVTAPTPQGLYAALAAYIPALRST
jgi:AAA domain